MHRLRAGFGCLLVLVASTTPTAQRAAPPTPPVPSLSAVSALDCRFTTSATATWTASTPQVVVGSAPPLEFRIGNIDQRRGTADRMIGALTVPTLLTVNGATFHFIEPPEEGSTAITWVMTVIGGNRFPASYSRTSYYAYSGPGFESAPKAEQLYGFCEPVHP